MLDHSPDGALPSLLCVENPEKWGDLGSLKNTAGYEAGRERGGSKSKANTRGGMSWSNGLVFSSDATHANEREKETKNKQRKRYLESQNASKQALKPFTLPARIFTFRLENTDQLYTKEFIHPINRKVDQKEK